MVNGSIQTYARLGGVLILLSLFAGGFGEAFAPSHVLVPGDAGATAHNIISSNTLFRAGFAIYTVEALCDVGLAVVFYLLLRVVNPGVAIFFVLFHLMATATFAFAEVFYFAPVFILGNDSYLRTFTADQLNTLALLSLTVYGFAGSFSQLFYGLASILLGYLMFRSGYLPRALGIMWILGGITFMASTYAAVLAPAYDSPLLRLPTILTILVTMVWLFVRGVDVPKWSRLRSARSAVAG